MAVDDSFAIDPSGYTLSGDPGTGDFELDPSGFSLSGTDMGGGFNLDPSLFNLGVSSDFGGLPSLPFNQQPTMLSPQQDMISRLRSFFAGGQQPGTAPGTPQQGGGLLDKGALALGGIGALGGLAGIFQQLSQGAPTLKQTTSRGPASPQEQALLAQTLSQLSQMQGLAQNAEIQQAISRLAAGQLPISSDLVDQVTKAFSAVAAGTAEQAIEGARERGFSGGTELLGQAGSPQFSRQMAQVQHDTSQALVNLALGLPQAASNIHSQQFGLGMQPIQAQMGLLGQMGAQAPQTQITRGPAPSLLDSMGPFANIMSGLGGTLGGYAAANRPPSGQDQFYAALANRLSGSPGAGIGGG